MSFDSSNHICSVAISKNNNIVAFKQEITSSRQAERLIPMIEETLNSCKCSYNNIDYLVVTNGPGSFTGIRVGLATAKGILLASNIIGFSISNFEILFNKATEQCNNYRFIVTIINAYRDQVYLQVFNKLGNKIRSPQLIDTKYAINIIKSLGHNIICTGSGIFPLIKELYLLNNITILPRFCYVKANHLCKYAFIKIKKGIFDPIKPIYIRVPNATIPTKNKIVI